MKGNLPKLLLAALAVGLVPLTGCDDDDDIFDEFDRLDAVLAPVTAVDASGRVDFQDGGGTAFDRLDVEFELDESDFADFDVDAADGFTDEDVILTIRNGSQEVYIEDLAFDQDRRATQGDVTWDLLETGFGVPDLRPGDVAEISVNGTVAVRGTLQLD
jgi:hypothetical protein